MKNLPSFTTQEVFLAYKKLKHYYYYDNTSLFIRQCIVEFEKSVEHLSGDYSDNFRQKISQITNEINKKDLDEWKAFFAKNVNYRITPKSFYKKEQLFISNRTNEQALALDRINIFIDAPIEVHLISVLWIMHVGKFLTSYIDEDNYAYKLELTDRNYNEEIDHGLRLYKPYFIQYQDWRDNAIKKAEQLLSEKKDV